MAYIYKNKVATLFNVMYTVSDRRNVAMGNNIKEVRKSKGITQKELADKLGVTPQAVSQFEKNDSKKFNISTIFVY